MIEPSLLIAGVGNVFLGDDAFGVEMARLLAERPWPPSVRVVDFGIRGFDLAMALLDGNNGTILVDALSRGGVPGTLYVLEPEEPGDEATELSPHALHPAAVLRLVRQFGGQPGWLRVVGCEPATFGTDEEPALELSPVVRAAIPEALRMVEELVQARLRELAAK